MPSASLMSTRVSVQQIMEGTRLRRDAAAIVSEENCDLSLQLCDQEMV